MPDLVPIAIFVGCLLATLGLVRACEWLRPRAGVSEADRAASRTTEARP